MVIFPYFFTSHLDFSGGKKSENRFTPLDRNSVTVSLHETSSLTLGFFRLQGCDFSTVTSSNASKASSYASSSSSSVGGNAGGIGKVNGYSTSTTSCANQKGVNGTATFSSATTGNGSAQVPKGVPPVCPVNASETSSGGQRLSYAQVAQHHKEKSELERQHAAAAAAAAAVVATPAAVVTSPSTAVNSHHNVSNSATTNVAQPTAATTPAAKTQTTAANSSTNATSFSDSEKKDSAHTQSTKSK